jgi:hypothetical protein
MFVLIALVIVMVPAMCVVTRRSGTSSVATTDE